MGEAIECVALVAHALVAARWVYTSVVTCPLKKALVDVYKQTQINFSNRLQYTFKSSTLILCSKIHCWFIGGLINKSEMP